MQRPVLRLIAAILLALAVLPLSAVSASAATYGVMLTVTDEKGVPLQGIGWEAWAVGDANGGSSGGNAATDANGQVWLDMEPGFAYRVCAIDDREEFFQTYRYQTRCWDGATSMDTATPIPINDTTPTANVTIQVPVAGLRIHDQTPQIYGTLAVGQTLQADVGVWSPSDVALSYLWRGTPADGASVTLGTAPSYTITDEASGLQISLEVTGTKAGYATEQAIGYWGVVGNPNTTLTSPLTITGTATVGSTLTATHGEAVPADTFRYNWRVDGQDVDLGWNKTLQLTSDMIGKRVSVYLQTSTYTSEGTNDLRAFVTGPEVGGVLTTATPTITGTVAVGHTLAANPGAWGPAPVTFVYQWYRSGTAVAGATAPTYPLTSADLGKTMTVKVTGTKANYGSASRTSAATAAVLNSFTTASTPTITGTRAVGYTLTANTGTWSPTPDSYAYQWYRAGVAISGATASTYKLTSYDKGKAITVKVTARKTGYVSTARTSAATGGILGVYSTAPTPTISGTKKVAYTLTANAGTWSPTPTSFNYQWYRGTTAISGATYRTYKLTSYDKGKVVKVKVTPVLTGYYSPGKYSAGYTIS